MKIAYVKLMVRQDDDAGLIRAFLAPLDGSERMEIATLALVVARNVEGAFEQWKDFLAATLQKILKDAGLEVCGMFEQRPHEGN